MIAKYQPIQDVTNSDEVKRVGKYSTPVEETTRANTQISGDHTAYKTRPRTEEATGTGAEDIPDTMTRARVIGTHATRLWAEIQSLRDEQRATTEQEELMLGQVLGDEIALFILTKIAETHTVELGQLAENLSVPHGWIALGKLLQARLIDVYGEVVVVTDAGANFLEWLASEQAEGVRGNVSETVAVAQFNG